LEIKNLKNMSIKRNFHDPIHKEIVFDAEKPEELMIMELIDTDAFQRLRRIKQLGRHHYFFMVQSQVDLPTQLAFFVSQEKFIRD